MMKLKEKLKKRGGFTLIEMLLVVAIVAILVVISIPMMTNALDEARKAADDANERAAKAEAAIVWLTEEEQKEFTKIYDAKTGQFAAGEANTVDAYGQYNGDTEPEEHQGKVIQAHVDDKGVIEITWVEGKK